MRLNRYINKYNLVSLLILISLCLIDLIFYLNSNSILVFGFNIVIVIFLILSYKFPEFLRIYNITKESQESLESYNKILELNSRDTTAWNNKGTIFAKTGKYNEAMKCFDKVHEIDPNDAAAWHNKGFVLDNLRRPQEAMEYYDKALILDLKSEIYNKSGKIILER
jgi:tetratricopeptide (TPR) repeat protein